MNLREALLEKKRNATEMAQRINSWAVYGEDSLVVFYREWHCSTEQLDKLLDYRALADHLILALPDGLSTDHLFQLQNLQTVDGIVLYSDPQVLLALLPAVKVANEGLSAEAFAAVEKERRIVL